MSRLQQFGLLLHKNWILQKRKVCVTVFEILMPVAFGLLLLVIRNLIETNDYPNGKIWSAFKPSQAVSNLTKTEILYAPNDAALGTIMTAVKSDMDTDFPGFLTAVTGFASNSDVETYHTNNPSKVLAAVVFDESVNYTSTTLPQNVQYSLRVSLLDGDTRWRTDRTFPFVLTTAPRNNDATGGEPEYGKTGFLYIQYLVNKNIMENGGYALVNNPLLGTTNEVYLRKMAFPPYLEDNMLTTVQTTLPLFFVLGFILYVIMLAKNLVYEKEMKLKESMKLMGMHVSMYWLSWFIFSLIYMLLACIFFTIFFSIKLKGVAVFTNSQPSIVFVFLLSYGLSLIAFSFMVSTFFQRASVAAPAAGIIFFLVYFPYFFLNQDETFASMTSMQKGLACGLNNVGMAIGVKLIAQYEGTGAGLQWNNFVNPPTVDQNFSMLAVILILLLDTLVYMLIAWYVDAICPGDFGVPQPLYFPFTKTYWCGHNHPEDFDDLRTSHTANPDLFEREPSGLKVGISIENLRKVYGKGKKRKVAVENTTLNVFEGQITVLLGHNGAGKTTTMSMLTGFIPPTRGTAKINSYDIRKDITNVRRSLGLCPQHNILFDTLTVKEHLIFYAKMKGCPSDQISKEVEEMVKIIGLEQKLNRYSMTLSGGQKRKLSVGIALIAGSKFVMLDEPTSGMDPAARRQTWDVLQKFRKDRTLVLTTHFMDEADLLGDRIAIMADGVVKCCGTSHFLKKKYGAGYHLVMVKNQSCNVSTVTQLIQSHIRTATLESDISAELSYLLPFDESSKFENLFKDVEAKKSQLGLTSFGTTATTMEEVFLKVGASATDDDEKDQNGEANVLYQNQAFVHDEKRPMSDSAIVDTKNVPPLANKMNGDSIEKRSSFNETPPLPNINGQSKSNNLMQNGTYNAFNENVKKNAGLALTMQQFYGMFVKKMIQTWRNRVVTLVQLIMPVLFTIFGLLVVESSPGNTADPALALELSSFGSGLTAIWDDGNATTGAEFDIANQYSNAITSSGNAALDAAAASNISTYLMNKADSVGISTFNTKYMIGAYLATSNSWIAYFNGEPFHTPAISLAYLMDAIFKYAMNSDLYSIKTTNSPFKLTVDENERANFFTYIGTAFSLAFQIMFGMAFLTATFIIFLIKERSSGAKHIQKVSGVSSIAFWASNFLWDLINYLIPVLLILIVFAAFQTEAFVDDNRLGIVFLIFVFYAWSFLPLTYAVSFFFSSAPSGMVAMTMLNIIIGLATLIAVFVLKIPGFNTYSIGSALDLAFAILFPNYCMGTSLMSMYVNWGYTKACSESGYPASCQSSCDSNGGDICFPNSSNYLDTAYPGVGLYILFLVAQGVVYFAILFMIENDVFNKCRYKVNNGNSTSVSDFPSDEASIDGKQEDNDVAEEKHRINSNSVTHLMETDSVIVKNLTKYYGRFHAVECISFGIAPNECFGLLGQNGAGKTTTFKMLTGDVPLTKGNAFMNKYDIKQHMRQVQQNLGYCPQFDALIDQMTGRETLYMYARLRGVQENQIKGVVNDIMDVMMLKKYADRECGTYSGGNKRKLSTAMALIGDPPFILLDEPTSGMDPGARRQLWNVLSQVRASGRTLILTSHSMEECDALCTKVVIMVNGKFVCYGSPQHLKNKFGHGYTLICQMKMEESGFHASTQPLKQFVKTTFPNSEIFDHHHGYCHFQIPDADIPLAAVFSAMERAKKDYNIEDYAVHQTTLEQVFLTFTQNQIPPKEEKKKGCCSSNGDSSPACCCCL
ncbi:phospholipid-transporting ATPase ABCA3-like [Mytilus californianus]|uniref:phospholipid-transporting ATPase ABCA3-like n=1 Tax=Mytilus californianus TaxID=6549 RepID=UPI0022479653|nr:phospholipid-transporting ATPase ABCA3-like [Mytilus californianus]